MDDREAKLEHLTSIALREAWLWSRAVHKLCDSIDRSSDDLDAQVDAMLLAVAYRNVYRGVCMALAHALPESAAQLRQVLARADSVAPGARAVRDMLEHFDDYEAGRGQLQQPGVKDRRADENLAREHLMYFERSGETFSLVVGGHKLSVADVRKATRLLVHGLHQHG